MGTTSFDLCDDDGHELRTYQNGEGSSAPMTHFTSERQEPAKRAMQSSSVGKMSGSFEGMKSERGDAVHRAYICEAAKRAGHSWRH